MSQVQEFKKAPNSSENIKFKSTFILSAKERKELDEKQKKLFLYNIYLSRYFKYYKRHLEKELAILKEAFPNVDFDILARIKSNHSYKEKIQTKGEALDIFADKIIIKSVDGKTDENLLIEYAYKIEDFLLNYNKSINDIPRKRKDYIKNPKANNYSSLHITRVIHAIDDDDKPIEFYAETQIKTFRMREVEKDGEASHSKAYKASRELFLKNISSPASAEYYMPKYMHFVFDKTSRIDKLVLDSFDERFKYFFHESYEDFLLSQKQALSQDEYQ